MSRQVNIPAYFSNAPNRAWHLQQLDNVEIERQIRDGIRPPAYHGMLAFKKFIEKRLSANHDLIQKMTIVDDKITTTCRDITGSIDNITKISDWLTQYMHTVGLASMNDSNAIQSLMRTFNALQKMIQSAKEDKRAIQSEIKERSAELVTLTQNAVNLRDVTRQLVARNAEESQKSKAIKTQEDISSSYERLQNVQSMIEEDELKLQQQKKKKDEVEEELRILQQQVKDLQEEHRQETIAKQTTSTDLATLNLDITTGREELNRIEDSLNHAKDGETDVRDRLATAESDNQRLEVKNQNLISLNTEQQQQIDGLENNMQELAHLRREDRRMKQDLESTRNTVLVKDALINSANNENLRLMLANDTQEDIIKSKDRTISELHVEKQRLIKTNAEQKETIRGQVCAKFQALHAYAKARERAQEFFDAFQRRNAEHKRKFEAFHMHMFHDVDWELYKPLEWGVNVTEFDIPENVFDWGNDDEVAGIIEQQS